MNRIRAKNIDDAIATTIIGILDGWSGKLSWDLLIDAIQRKTRNQYTRQALHRHERIYQAFETRKKALAKQATKEPDLDSLPPELKVAMQQIELLSAKVDRLERENRRLLEQFVRWAYNAHTRNLSEEFLNSPLPPVDRERTRPARGELRKVARKA